jgi:hypothetical protein
VSEVSAELVVESSRVESGLRLRELGIIGGEEQFFVRRVGQRRIQGCSDSLVRWRVQKVESEGTKIGKCLGRFN